MELLKNYRKMALIQRMSGHYKKRSYNLLEHSFLVMSYFKFFAEKEGIEYGLKELDLISNHDLIETETGDLISPVKYLNLETKACWANIEDCVVEAFPHLKRYSDENLVNTLNKKQFELFKSCDHLDLYVFCLEEETLGNRSQSVIDIITKLSNIFNDEQFPFRSIQEYISIITR